MNNAELVAEIKLLQAQLSNVTDALKGEAGSIRAIRELCQELKIQNELLKQTMHQQHLHIKEHCVILEDGKGNNKGVLDRLASLEERDRLEDALAVEIESRFNKKLAIVSAVVGLIEALDKFILPLIKTKQ